MARWRRSTNVEITPSIDLRYYGKGAYTWDGGKWVKVGCDDANCETVNTTLYACQNEDVQRTGNYQAALDINHNGQMDPSRADVLISAEGGTKTDENGQVVLKIEYAKNLGSWLEYQILVSAGVAGTEGRKTWTDVLGVPITDTTAPGEPAFVVSPYGVVTQTVGGVPPCQNAN